MSLTVILLGSECPLFAEEKFKPATMSSLLLSEDVIVDLISLLFSKDMIVDLIS